jgi:glycosyltransferase involved in cell wall biosynthesis
MEYMACGKPVIATCSSGHRDILTEHNSLPLRNMKKMKINTNKGVSAVWDDPDLDEIIARLEWAYENRDSLPAIGQRAGDDLSRLTWTQSSRDFLTIAREG